MYSVYRFTFPNGKLYFGITSCAKVEHRWGKGKNYNGLVRNAINKYGWEHVKKDILYSDLSQEDAEKLEMKLISEYNTTDTDNGYNISTGGKSCRGYHPSEETREKLRAYARNRPQSHLDHISQSLKGREISEEQRRSISAGRKGKLHTEEAKAKIGYASAHRSEQAKENHRKSLLGRKVTAETRAKISAAQSRIPKPDWLKERFREAALNRTAEQTYELARSRSKPIYCVTSHKIYMTMKDASIAENVSEERIGYSIKHHKEVKGKVFLQHNIGTDVNDLLNDDCTLMLGPHLG